MRKVLLIDDDPVQLRIREAVLRGAGFEVSVADTAEKALNVLLEELASIAAVITDHIMPDVPGDEFVREARRLNPSVPIIVVSGLAEAQESYEGLNIIFRQKPCPPSELISLVRRFVKSAA